VKKFKKPPPKPLLERLAVSPAAEEEAPIDPAPEGQDPAKDGEVPVGCNENPAAGDAIQVSPPAASGLAEIQPVPSFKAPGSTVEALKRKYAVSKMRKFQFSRIITFFMTFQKIRRMSQSVGKPSSVSGARKFTAKVIPSGGSGGNEGSSERAQI
jgi:hypothetical protein